MRTALALAAALAVTIVAPAAHALTVQLVAHPPAEVGAPLAFEAIAEGAGELSYEWRFGDGSTLPPSPSPTATHAYDQPGHYPVIVIVRDARAIRSGTFIQTVHHPLTAARPTASSSIVSDASGARVYLVNPDQDTVASLDATAMSLRWERPVGPGPSSLALAPDGRLWVVSQDSASINVLDAEQGRLEATIVLPYASRPAALAFSPDGSAAYVSLQATGELVRLDPVTHALTGRVAVGRLPAALAVSHDGARVLVTRLISPAERGEVVEVDGASLAVVAVRTLALDPGPDGEFNARGVPNYLTSVAISPDGRRAWLPSKKDNVLRGGARDGLPLGFESSVRAIVSQLDLGAGAEVPAARRDLNDRALPSAITFSPPGDYAFVALEGTNHVEVFDAYTGLSVASAREVGRAPRGLVLTPDGKLFVHAFLSRTVIVYDASALLRAEDFAFPRLAEIASVTGEKLAADVLRGKQLFYDAADTRMTRDGYLSCATCHLDGFEDGQVWDFTDRGEGLRNTTSLLGKRGVGQGRLHWSANFDEVQDFEHDMRNAFGGKGFLADADFHTGTRDTSLGDAKAGVSPELDALAAYVSSLDRVHPSPFRNPDGSLGDDARAGEALFGVLGCAVCHAGADFTDSTSAVLHDVGTIKPTSGHRLGGELTGLDTPTLLGVWATAPYLHDGSAPTLRDVLTTANPQDLHGVTSTLGAEEIDQLVAYLLALDQGPPPAPLYPEPLLEDGGAAPAPDAAGPAVDDENGSGCGCRVAERRTRGAGASTLLGAVLACLLVWTRLLRGGLESTTLAGSILQWGRKHRESRALPTGAELARNDRHESSGLS